MRNHVIRWPKRVISAETERSHVAPKPAQSRRLSDEDLVQRLREGQEEALSALFERYYRLVLKIASRIVRDAGEAEDVMQEVFFEIYRKADHFDGTKGSARTWILQYAYHRSLNRRRYLALRESYSRKEIAELEVLETHYSPNGASQLTHAEAADVVHQGLATLSQKQRETLELAFFDGLLLSEIAHRKKESIGNVRHYYYRGLQKLRSFLQNGSAGRGIKKQQLREGSW